MTILRAVGFLCLSLLALVPAQAVPTFTVTSPAQNASVPSGTVVIAFAAVDFTLGDQGQTHLHFRLDADPVTYHFYNGATKEVHYLGGHTHTVHWRSTTSIEIYGLSSAAHQVRFVLANADHSELTNLEAAKTLNFTVLTPPAAQFTLQPVASSLSFPVGMAFAPDGRLFYNEWQTGKVRVMDPGWSLRSTAFYQVPDLLTGAGEQGMLGLTIDPNFTDNHFIYIYYDALGPNRCRVLRLKDVSNVGTDPTYIFDNIPEGTIHNSGALNFGKDGKLYITTGDATAASENEPDAINPYSESQNPNSLNGKVLRINKDGTIPPDNPTAGSPIWAKGLRNTFGAAFHPDTGDLWSTENGPDSNDEVNRLIAGGNYGWPLVGGITGNPLYVDPIVAFTPTIAPTGIIGLRANTVYPPEYQHNLFLNDWKGGKIRRIILTGPGLKDLGSISVAYNGGFGGLVAMTQGLDGYVYVSSNNAIYRMVFSGNQPPKAVSVSPSSGSGASQKFTFTYSDANGFADLPWAEMLINSSLNTATGCYLRFERAANRVSLRDDFGALWLGPATLGSAVTLENSRCKVFALSSSSSGSSANLTVNLDLSFKLAFAGAKNVYMQAQDNGGLATGWQQRGTWNVTALGGNLAPSAVSVTPFSAIGARLVFSFLYSDPNGATDLPWVEMMVNGSTSPLSACYIRYDRAANTAVLRNDAGTAWSGPLTLGSATTTENSQCQLYAATSSAVAAGDNLTVNLDLSFKAAFTGAKNVYMQTQDIGGLATGWQLRGYWALTNLAPSAVSVTPSSGTGERQVFSFLYSDPNGATDILWAQVLLNSTLTAPNGCYIHFNRALNIAYLLNDAGTAWLGPSTLGSATTIENSQCKLHAATSAAAVAGNNLTVNLDLSFQVAFAGAKNIYMQTQDIGGLASGWQLRGTWVTAQLPPSAVSVTPSSGAGARQVFSFLYSDPNGASDLPWAQVVINSTLSAVSGCYIHFGRALNTAYLLNDAGTAWSGPATLGSATTIENSQCKLYAATSSSLAAGNNLTVNLDLSFTVAFAGAKNVYMETQDTVGLATGWQLRGTWDTTNLAPSAVSVTPSSGAGARQVFSFLYSDPNGATDLPWAQVLINSTLNALSGCYIHFDRALNMAFLLNDAATAWGGPATLGSATTIENSQCKLYAATSAASAAGNNLTVNLDLSFMATFTGAKNVYMQTQDTAGLATGWQQLGAWTVP